MMTDDDRLTIRMLVDGGRELLWGAKENNTGGALWRLVDAAGMLSCHSPDEIGAGCVTGRGYVVVDRQLLEGLLRAVNGVISVYDPDELAIEKGMWAEARLLALLGMTTMEEVK
jgi:hypothetical protein